MTPGRPEDQTPDGQDRTTDPAHAFAAGRMPEPPAEQARGPAVPSAYAQDRLEAIALGPTLLFVYWELTGEASTRLRERLGQGLSWILRFSNVGAGWRADIPVDPESGNYYLKVRPGGRYVVELGIGVGGTFRAVCQSGECLVPRETPGPRREPVWAEVRVGAAGARGAHPAAVPGRIPPDGAKVAGLSWRPGMMRGSSAHSGRPVRKPAAPPPVRA